MGNRISHLNTPALQIPSVITKKETAVSTSVSPEDQRTLLKSIQESFRDWNVTNAVQKVFQLTFIRWVVYNHVTHRNAFTMENFWTFLELRIDFISLVKKILSQWITFEKTEDGRNECTILYAIVMLSIELGKWGVKAEDLGPMRINILNFAIQILESNFYQKYQRAEIAKIFLQEPIGLSPIEAKLLGASQKALEKISAVIDESKNEEEIDGQFFDFKNLVPENLRSIFFDEGSLLDPNSPILLEDEIIAANNIVENNRALLMKWSSQDEDTVEPKLPKTIRIKFPNNSIILRNYENSMCHAETAFLKYVFDYASTIYSDAPSSARILLPFYSPYHFLYSEQAYVSVEDVADFLPELAKESSKYFEIKRIQSSDGDITTFALIGRATDSESERASNKKSKVKNPDYDTRSKDLSWYFLDENL